MTIPLVILICIGALVTGAFAGLVLCLYNYPDWEVKKVFRHMKKEGYRIGEWRHVKELVDHRIKVVVKPGRDVLYSLAFIKPGKNTYRLEMMSYANYFSFAFLDKNTDVMDYYTNRDVRSDGQVRFLITGKQHPKEHSEVPVIELNSGFCWIIARFGVFQTGDVKRINMIQDSLKLIPVE